MDKVNIAEKLEQIRGYWKPHIVGELNGQHVKLTKLKGRFVWHYHKDEDEMFLVLKGRLLMELRDKKLWIEEGEFIIVPRGVEHRPNAKDEVQILLFEPVSTLNTGNVRNRRTLEKLRRI
jgi:mannose-6-phosphate isomerase-like protein (cupin superfamily)